MCVISWVLTLGRKRCVWYVCMSSCLCSLTCLYIVLFLQPSSLPFMAVYDTCWPLLTLPLSWKQSNNNFLSYMSLPLATKNDVEYVYTAVYTWQRDKQWTQRHITFDEPVTLTLLLKGPQPILNDLFLMLQELLSKGKGKSRKRIYGRDCVKPMFYLTADWIFKAITVKSEDCSSFWHI